MEIRGKSPLVDLNATIPRLDVQQQNQRAQKKTGEEHPQSGPDRLELSVEIRQLEELVRQTPDTREAKVEQLRSAIENGTYDVNAKKIAEKILKGSVVDELI